MKLIIEGPISTLDNLTQQLVGKNWKQTVVLSSAGNIIFVLVGQEKYAIQINLQNQDLASALQVLKKSKNFKLIIIDDLQAIVKEGVIELQQTILDGAENCSMTKLKAFFNLQKCKSRGSISIPTAKKVCEASHGICMFEGCGEVLVKDYLTNTVGNFAYLAHIVAASPDGPRGDSIRSEQMSNMPENIMYLCDKHHRLIDRIALIDYPESVLVKMRQDFLNNIESILSLLKFDLLQTFCCIWEIGGSMPSPPLDREVTKSLIPLKAQGYSSLRVITPIANCRSSEQDWWNHEVPNSLDYVLSALKNMTKDFSLQSAIYPIAPMPILIALGAKIGNKNNIVIIPRSRESGWGWSNKYPNNDFDIEGIEEIPHNTEHVNILFYLTDASLPVNNGYSTITIKARNMGNDSVSTPLISQNLLMVLNNLFTRLKREYQVKWVHLFPCASNVACLELGRAIEHNHSDFIIYDYINIKQVKQFKPRLKISMHEDKIQITGM